MIIPRTSDLEVNLEMEARPMMFKIQFSSALEKLEILNVLLGIFGSSYNIRTKP